jgi:2-polyprenyl-3-methyl-5-hydroxy-6-metoxy-1,4-benzoquinol methylase
MNTLLYTTCPLCDSENIAAALTVTDFHASGEIFMIYECADCQFLFTQDAPTGGAMDRYYNSRVYLPHSEHRKGFLNRTYYIVRHYMLARKAHLVMREAHRTHGRLLDIGTGTGYFPAKMQEKGWQVVATEKNKQARLFARRKFGLDVRPAEALYEIGNDGAYDVITLWHVLEHLENLDTVWGRFYELLAPKGILVVAVPNASSFDASLLGPYWAAYDVPRHLWHFTPATIQQMASKYGFIMAARHPMPFDAFYIAMLSERNKGRKASFIRGLSIGVGAWLRALVRKDRSSSMIYIFRMKTI